jgi:hypothetical protein
MTAVIPPPIWVEAGAVTPAPLDGLVAVVAVVVRPRS